MGEGDRQAAPESAERAGKAAGEVVASEHGGAVLRGHRLAQRSLLDGEEEAHVTRRGVERARDRDEEQRPERGDAEEADPRGEHQPRRAEQDAPPAEALAEQPDRERERRRAEQGARDQRPDLEGVEAEREQVLGEQHADGAVGEPAERAGDDQPPRVGGSARGEQGGEPARDHAAPSLAVMRGPRSGADRDVGDGLRGAGVVRVDGS